MKKIFWQAFTFVMLFCLDAVFPLQGMASVSAATHPDLLQFRAGKHILGFAAHKAYLAAADHALSVEFVNSLGILPEADWLADSPGAASRDFASTKVVYRNLWKGINLTYLTTKDGIAESVYHVAPEADISAIRLRYNVPVELQEDGSLCFRFTTGFLTESAPIAWQEVYGKRLPVQIAFRSTGEEIGFQVGPYDRTQPLIIDPTYQWHTFYGSVMGDSATGIAVDSSGNIYITGFSWPEWQGDNASEPLHPFPAGDGWSIYVLKLNSAGQYQWHTFYGPDNTNARASGITLDGKGNIYVTGTSQASWQGDNATNPLHSFSGGVNGYDIVVLKLDSAGQYQWHTFYGSSTGGNAIAISSNDLYITGSSPNSWLGDNGEEALHAHSGSGNQDVFVMKLTTAGAYRWHTYYGDGITSVNGQGIIVLGSNVYLTGYTNRTWLGNNDAAPLHQFAGNYRNIFVMKLAADGAYGWHTFYGSYADYGTGIATDGLGNLFISGTSYSTWQGDGNASPLHPFTGGSRDYDFDLLVLNLGTDGGYRWHTFYPGSSDPYFQSAKYGITADGDGNIHVTGPSGTSWQGDNATAPLHPYTYGGDIVVLGLNGSGLYQWHAFYGSFEQDYGFAIAMNSTGVIHVTGGSEGWLGDENRPPLHPYNYNWGVPDAFVLKIATNAPSVTTSPVTGITTTTAVSGGNAAANGGLALSARGVCWDIHANPTLANTCTNDGTANGTFISSLTGLVQNMTYHVRAYATSASGTTYGNDIDFTTLPVSGKVNLTIETAGYGSGTVSGTPDINCAMYPCIKTLNTGSVVSVSATPIGGSVFGWYSSSGSTDSCDPYTAACQFTLATNSTITATFSELPVVTTKPPSNISSRSAKSGGFVTYSGGEENIFARGVCWSMSPKPTRADNCTNDGNGASWFVSSITGLAPATSYHIRAYAQNSAGAAYGEELQFTTTPRVPLAYISNLYKDGIELFDTGTNFSIGLIPTGIDPYGVAVNPSETRVYVANSGSDTVSVIDTATISKIATISVGDSPMGIAVNMPETRVYAANALGNSVSVINTNSHTVEATIAVGASPNGIAVNPAGSRVYVANSGGNSVSVINSADNTAEETVTVGAGPFGLAVSPDGSRLYVTNLQGNSVSVIDTATLTVIGSAIPVGNAPYGIAVNPDGTRVYVSNRDSNSVSVIDTATAVVIGSPIAVGGSPRGVSFTPDGTRAYVANYQHNNISVIDTATNTVTTTMNAWNNPVGFGRFIRPPLAGDLNHDEQVNFVDAILGLQIASGIVPSQAIFKDADVNGDHKIGIQEVVYVLKKIAL